MKDDPKKMALAIMLKAKPDEDEADDVDADAEAKKSAAEELLAAVKQNDPDALVSALESVFGLFDDDSAPPTDEPDGDEK